MEMLFKRITPSPRSVRTSMVYDKYIALNPSRSKNLIIGMDVARDFQPAIVFENASGRTGVRLEAEDFSLVFDARFVAMVNKHMVKPYDVPGPSRQGTNVDLRCVRLADNEPALKVSTSDGNYCLLGAITWERLQNLSGYLLSLLHDMEHILSKDLYCWVALCMADMVNAAHAAGFTSFDSEKMACFFLKENVEKWFVSKNPPPPYGDILKELFAKHSDICSRVLYDAVMDNMFVSVD